MKKSSLLLGLISAVTSIFAGNNAKTGDIQYIANNGQWANHILYSTPVYGGNLFLEQNCFTYYFSNMSEIGELHHSGNKNQLENFIIKKHAFRVSFVGANPNITLVGENKFANYYNYFLGNDQSKWQGKVPAYGAIRYPQLYDGIDMLVYSQSSSVKYDYIVKPGADANKIKVLYDGLDNIQLVEGNLELTTSINKMIELKPVAYQMINGSKVNVLCEYLLDVNNISFSFPNGYDKNYELVIDPATLIFASYTGSSADNWGNSATFDNEGFLYGAGMTFGDGYPLTIGAYQSTWGGGGGFYVGDITLSKFTADGTSLVYSTYLGGNSEDQPYSLYVSPENELVVFGSTGSANFPVTAGAYDETFNGGPSITVDDVLAYNSGSDGVITKFATDGASLIGSTFFGGTQNDALLTGAINYNYSDHARGEVIVDGDGNICIASCTRSSNLPVTAGVFQVTLGGQQDGFIARFNNSLTTLQWCSFVGGSLLDGTYSIKPMATGDYVICGGTNSNNFPTTPGALHETFQGGTADGYVAIISNDATDLKFSTYIGTNQYDQTYLTELDEENSVFITGQTRGAYPVVGSVYENPGSSQYITKLNSSLSTIVYSTVFGSGSDQVNISPTAFLVDNCKNIYVCGWGGSVNQLVNFEAGTVDGMAVTPDAIQSTTDGSDFYLAVFGENLSTLEYATYFGGDFSSEHVDGGTSRFDKQGVVYHAVCAGCGGNDDFPTTDGVVSNTNGSENCNLGVFKISLAPPVTSASFTNTPSSGCYPVDVDFSNESGNAVAYSWDFGDGTTSTEENPSHTYNEPGEYTITLVAYVDGDCGINDTVTTVVTVYDYPVAGFTSTPEMPSTFSPVIFTSTSTDASTWEWEFGDGFTSSEENPTHLYPLAGAYEVCLTVTTENGCEDKICDSVIIEEISLLDIPNAFSPNGDGFNDEFLPFNYGMANYELTIYNRWGEVVFSTSTASIGWDGTFEGKVQEIGTYVYVVSGSGVDNVQYYKQGNFTLVL